MSSTRRAKKAQHPREVLEGAGGEVVNHGEDRVYCVEYGVHRASKYKIFFSALNVKKLKTITLQKIVNGHLIGPQAKSTGA